MNEKFEKFVTVNFKHYTKDYYFGVQDSELEIGDFAIADTSFGLELVELVSKPKDVSELPGEYNLKPLLRPASKQDIDNYEKGLVKSKEAMESIEKYIDQLGLKMRPLSAKYSLDLKKVLIVYVSEERVDFRELLRLLNADLRVRIELKQIGERDKAKMVSGLATCGMETCCSRFMGDFEMISINMAKNQNLALNISKLSGLCGKFMCCLKHEDDMYSEAKKEWPPLNSKVMYKGEMYYVNGMNYLSEEAKLVNKEETLFVPFNEAFYDYLRKQKKALKEQEENNTERKSCCQQKAEVSPNLEKEAEKEIKKVSKVPKKEQDKKRDSQGPKKVSKKKPFKKRVKQEEKK